MLLKTGITAHIFSYFFREILIVLLWAIHKNSVVVTLMKNKKKDVKRGAQCSCHCRTSQSQHGAMSLKSKKKKSI